MRSPAKICILALLIAGGFALSSLERAVPNPFPMIRLGLGNIMTLVAFAILGVREGVWVTAGRVLLVAVAWGGLLSPTAVLSAAGGAASLLAMVPLVMARGRFSLLGVSVAGACAHVMGQLGAAYLFFVRSEGVLAFLPIMGAAAVLTGVFNALVARRLVRRLRSQNPETRSQEG